MFLKIFLEHADHIGGLRAILRNFHPRELWYGPNYPSPEVQSVLDAADQLGARRVERHEGDEFDFDGVHISVLSPPAVGKVLSEELKLKVKS